MSFIPSFDIISVVVQDRKSFLWFSPVISNGPTNLPRNNPDCIILDN